MNIVGLEIVPSVLRQNGSGAVDQVNRRPMSHTPIRKEQVASRQSGLLVLPILEALPPVCSAGRI